MSSRHSKGSLSNRLHLSAERKKNRGENLIAWRKRAKENALRNVAIQCDLNSFESENQMVQLNKQEVSVSQEILPNNLNSSNIGISLDMSHEQTSFTPTSYLFNSEPYCGEKINQEPNQDSSSSMIEHSLPSIKHSFSLNPCRTPESNFRTGRNLSHQHSSLISSNHLLSSQAIQIKQESNQNSYSSSENSLPSIKNSFSLNPIETPDSVVCSTSTDNRNDLDTRLDLLSKNWAEKMKSLTNDQRIYAEKLINDVFFLAEVGRLRHVYNDGQLWLKIEK